MHFLRIFAFIGTILRMDKTQGEMDTNSKRKANKQWAWELNKNFIEKAHFLEENWTILFVEEVSKILQ